jgi:integrase
VGGGTGPRLPIAQGDASHSREPAPSCLRPAAEEAGASCAGFHTFRHTCGSMLFEGGKNAKQVQTEARPSIAELHRGHLRPFAPRRAGRAAQPVAELEKCHGSEEPTGFSQLAVLARHFSTDDAVRPEA